MEVGAETCAGGAPRCPRWVPGLKCGRPVCVTKARVRSQLEVGAETCVEVGAGTCVRVPQGCP
eukprot:1151654-Pelagomonas_calceolata.AAC.3